jgi:hypothetical protein
MRFARLIDRPGRVLGGPAVRAAFGGTLSLTCLPLTVVPNLQIQQVEIFSYVEWLGRPRLSRRAGARTITSRRAGLPFLAARLNCHRSFDRVTPSS